MKRLVYLFVAASIFMACNDENEREPIGPAYAKKLDEAERQKKLEKERLEREEERKKNKEDYAKQCLELIQKDSVLSKYYAFNEKYKSKYDQIGFALEWNGETFYLPIKGKHGWFDGGQSHFEKIGLVNQLNESILPVEYDFLYTPNKICDGCMEVQKNGKQGLIDLRGNFIFLPEFDIIYPGYEVNIAGFEDVLAVAYNKEGYQLFLKDSITEVVSIDNEEEIQRRLFTENPMKQWVFNIKTDIPFINLNTALDNAIDPEGRGYFVPPSYMEKFGLIKKELFNMLVSEYGYIGSNEMKVRVESVEEPQDGLWMMISKFFMEASDARGYMEDRKILSYIDVTNEVKSEKVVNTMDWNLCNDSLYFWHLNDSTYIARSQKWGEEYYQTIESYTVFLTNRDGVQKMETKRPFGIASLVEIDSTFFKGCWRRYLVKTTEHGESGDLLVIKELRPEDLDVMRNEIFAAHGYKFKSKKWQEYFSKFKWYKPEYDNVDGVLSEIEKKNIKYILDYKESIKNRSIVVDTLRGWGAAG